MSTYDLKRLETAIQYIRRMTEGRNPVTNRPAPENEVLINTNVNRCLKFVQEVLEDVHAAGGTVGKPPRRTAAPKPQVYETFPYEVLDRYRYIQDQQISYFLKQIEDLLPEDQEMKVRATMLTDWLRENEYLVRQKMENSEKEVSVPTQKGIDLGLYSEKAGMFPNEYYRVYYNEKAQRFLVDNFRRILTEVEEIRARRKQEKKKAAPGSVTGPVNRSGRSGGTRESAQPYGDPAFDSLVASIPTDAGGSYADDYPDPGSMDYGQWQDSPESAPGAGESGSANTAGYAGGSAGYSDMADFMGEGWESVDEGLPW